MKRGQTSTEYIIIAAIVLVILVIGVQLIMNFPLGRETAQTQIAQEYWKTADIAITSWAGNYSHLVLQIQNNVGQTLNITRVEVDDIQSDVSLLLYPGQMDVLVVDASWDPNVDLYQAEINFVYQDVETQTQYTFYGQAPLSGQVSSLQQFEASGTPPPFGDACVDCVRGSGSQNYIPRWTSSSELGNSIMYQTSSRIGVGTTTPQGVLDVNGTLFALNISSPVVCLNGDCRSVWPDLAGSGFTQTQGPYLYDDDVTVFFNETRLNLTIDARAGSEAQWDANYSSLVDNQVLFGRLQQSENFYFQTNRLHLNASMRFDNETHFISWIDGNMRIGRDSGNMRFNIYSDSNGFDFSSTTGDNLITIRPGAQAFEAPYFTGKPGDVLRATTLRGAQGPGTQGGDVNITGGFSTVEPVYSDGHGGSIHIQTGRQTDDSLGNEGNRGTIGFYTYTSGNTPTVTLRMRIDADGKVGIGTDTPDATLDVVGNIVSSTNITSPMFCIGSECITAWPGSVNALNSTQGPYLSDDSSTIFFNETLLNLTIDLIASAYNETDYIDAQLLNYYIREELYNRTEIDDMLVGFVDTVWDIEGSPYLYNDSGVLKVNETALNATIEEYTSAFVSGSGTAGYVALWESSDTLEDSVIFQNGTNIGIGTLQTNASLHLIGNSGTLDAIAWFKSTNNHANLFIDAMDGRDANVVFAEDGTRKWYIGHSTIDDRLMFRSYNGSTNEQFTILQDGNVGIGNINPTYKLHVSGDIYASANITAPLFCIGSNCISEWPQSDGNVSGSGSAGYVARWSSTGNIVNSIIFDNQSAIGVGTDSPQSTLDVNGTLNVEESYALNTTTFICENSTHIVIGNTTGIC
ncbi:MAG: hypothetical protein ACMXYC_03140 [Candidatus Woesearchaeota archaeon]